ncbi:MAG: hypothetical protein HJJLKODD_00786 [Phycisphaerae bacterium]|nr:hypothetical protein [Phycisphaerae bacterium]
MSELIRSVMIRRYRLKQRVMLVHIVLMGGVIGGTGACRPAEKSVPLATELPVIGGSGTQTGHFIEPRAIAVNHEGQLYVIDRSGRLQQFDNTGLVLQTWTIPDAVETRGKPSGLGLDSTGRLYIADTHNHRVLVMNQQGQELLRFGELGEGPGQFFLPTDVAIDEEGAIFVSEYGGHDRISKFDHQGHFLFSFGDLGAGSAALRRPSGMNFDHHQQLWVADTNNHRVVCFTRQGELVRTFGEMGTAPGQLRFPRDVIETQPGVLAVVEEYNHRVSFFTTAGEYLYCVGQPGNEIGQFNTPLNLAWSSNCLYVVDSKNHRLQRLWVPQKVAARSAVDDSAIHAARGRS